MRTNANEVEAIELTVGQYVRDTRKARGMSQTELGQAFGDARGSSPLSRSSVSQLECGKRSFMLADLIALSATLEVSLAELLNLQPSTGNIGESEREAETRAKLSSIVDDLNKIIGETND